VQAGRRGSFLDVRRRDIPVPAGLRGEDPDHAVFAQGGQRIHQAVHKVPVAVAPPEDDGIRHFVIILIEQLGTREVLNIVTQVEIDVVVVTELLNQIPVLETQFFRHIYRSGGVGLAHVFLQCLIHAVRIVISITPKPTPFVPALQAAAP